MWPLRALFHPRTNVERCPAVLTKHRIAVQAAELQRHFAAVEGPPHGAGRGAGRLIPDAGPSWGATHEAGNFDDFTVVNLARTQLVRWRTTASTSYHARYLLLSWVRL